MDPDQTLVDVLKYAHNVRNGEEQSSEDIFLDATALAQAVLDLHRWLRDGGFLPLAWCDAGERP